MRLAGADLGSAGAVALQHRPGLPAGQPHQVRLAATLGKPQPWQHGILVAGACAQVAVERQLRSTLATPGTLANNRATFPAPRLDPGRHCWATGFVPHHGAWQPGGFRGRRMRREPKVRHEGGQADQSIARSAPLGAAAVLPQGGSCSGLRDRGGCSSLMGCSEPPWRCTALNRDVVSDRCAADRATMGWAAKPRMCWSGWYEGP